MSSLSIIISILVIISFLLIYIQQSSQFYNTEEMIKDYEKNRPTYDQFRVLPFEVKPLLIEYSDAGLIRLTLTPTYLQQSEDSVFTIPVKAHYNEESVGFELVLNTVPLKDEEMTENEEGMTVFFMETNSEIADNFLKILANLFEIELSNKAQIVKGLFLFSEEEEITQDSLNQGHEFILYFGDKAPSNTTPAIRLFINLNIGKIIFEELDSIFRPIIIDRLTFKPNIRN